MIHKICGAAQTDINSSAMTAQTAYALTGYTTDRYADPAPLTVFSNVISREVLLLLCHGNADHVSFEDGGITRLTTNSYEFGIPNSTVKSRDMYSIQNLDLSHIKLMTLASCQSAGTQASTLNSIAGMASNNGAQTTIGWYVKVNSLVSEDSRNIANTELNSRASKSIMNVNNKSLMKEDNKFIQVTTHLDDTYITPIEVFRYEI